MTGGASVGVGDGVGVGVSSGLCWAGRGDSGRPKLPTSGTVVGGTCALATPAMPAMPPMPATQSAATPAANRIFVTPAMLIALTAPT